MRLDAKLVKYTVLPALFAWTSFKLAAVLSLTWPVWVSISVGLAAGWLIAYIGESPLAVARAIPPAWRKAMVTMQEHRRQSAENRRELRQLASQHRRFVRWHLLFNVSAYCWILLFSGGMLGMINYLAIRDPKMTTTALTKVGLMTGGTLLGIVLLLLLLYLTNFRRALEYHRDADETDQLEVIQDYRECVLKWNFLTIWFYLIYLFIFNVFFSLLPALVGGIFYILVAVPRFLGLFIANIYLMIHSDLRLMMAVDTCCGFLVGVYFWNPLYAALAGAAFGFFNYAIVLKRWLIRYEAVRVKVGHRL